MLSREEAKDWRLKNRLTQEKVGELLKVSTLTYAKFERGTSEGMSYGTMKRLDGLVESYKVDRIGESPGSYGEGTQPAIQLIAKDLRHLADILDSPDYSRDFKAVKFEAWITFAYNELASVLQAMKKLPEKNPET